MSILMLMFVIAVVGAVAWFLVTYLPMPVAIKNVIIGVAVVACVLYALHAMGIQFPSPRVPRVG